MNKKAKHNLERKRARREMNKSGGYNSLYWLAKKYVVRKRVEKTEGNQQKTKEINSIAQKYEEKKD